MHTDIRQLLELIPIVPNEQIKTCCSMMDHLDREVIFKNEFVAFMVELNEAFKNVYIENPDGTLILLI